MRTWSEKNGRTDIIVHGYSWAEIGIVSLAGLAVVIGAIAVLAVMP